MYYFAYGSNMNVKRMEKRKVNFTNRCAAHLQGYHLEFNKVAIDNHKKGYANIVADDSGIVEGALYDLDADSLPTLDKCEGYPEEYLKNPVKLTLLANGQEVCAIAYIANPKKIKEGLKPCKEYLGHLLKGEDILSKNYLDCLTKTETLD